MDHDHTLKHMRSEVFFPEIANRDMREIWESAGKPDAHARALAIAKRILTKENPALFSEDIDKRIRERFPGLVKGEPGWYE